MVLEPGEARRARSLDEGERGAQVRMAAIASVVGTSIEWYDFFLFSISLAVTVLGLAGSWAAARRRGAASGLRGAAWSLVPLGLYLTGLTKFLADLVFSPLKWAGVIVLGLGAVLYMASGVMLRRGGGDRPATGSTGTPRVGRGKAAPEGGAKGGSKGALEQRQPAVDPDLAEIEQILKNRGIS